MPTAPIPTPPSVQPRPRPRAVLIGTSETVEFLSSQLAMLPAAPTAEGILLIGSGGDTEGEVDRLAGLCRDARPDMAIVSLPAARASTARRVSAILAELGVAERVVTPLAELLEKAPAPTPIRKIINWAELVGRAPHSIDRAAAAKVVTGKRVLITGAGGSIGSEIARIVASLNPEAIILMERSENALFEIDRQLGQRYPTIRRHKALHDVVQPESTLRHLCIHRPHTVFHAAAHKHVPMMEDHPAHAVTNNFFGTKSIADASLAAGVERFVLISSDKAVNPTSIMGATKRLAEMYVQALHRRARRLSPAATRFGMVRFGNVLGSACSVLPIWESQIAEGGPVTVTDERMTRYFMTIHEAASLVIQSASLDEGSEIAPVYVLDMGQPVRILDLAERFVRACGYTPVVRRAGETAKPISGLTDPTCEISVTGARPGEKLYEELAYASELLIPTAITGIRAQADADAVVNLPQMVADLSAVRDSTDKELVSQTIRALVPEMRRGITGAAATQTGPERPSNVLAA